jgi:RNA polymerase sigma factor (sigma-70 family)
MDEDAEHLRRFAETHDEGLFRAVVDRHVGFVYAVNLRRLRDAHLAGDATQAVFIALARKAAQVARGPSVRGWLHRSSGYESRNLMRARRHREEREQAAVLIGTVTVAESAPEPAPGLDAVLDEALAELGAKDREAILARFFAGKSFAEMGAEMGRTESAARMRVERALERLRAGRDGGDGIVGGRAGGDAAELRGGDAPGRTGAKRGGSGPGRNGGGERAFRFSDSYDHEPKNHRVRRRALAGGIFRPGCDQHPAAAAGTGHSRAGACAPADASAGAGAGFIGDARGARVGGHGRSDGG